MNIKRGISTTYIIPARQLSGETHYLFVFQNVDRKAFYQYAITTNEASTAGPLMLPVEEKDNAVALDGEVTLEQGDWNVLVYAQGSSTNLDPASTGRRIHTELIRVHTDTDTPAVYPPSGGVCEGVDILDGDGNVIAHVNDGDTYTVDEMPYIAATYASLAAASADTTTVPTSTQAIKVAGRLYQGDGTKTSAELVAAKVFNPSFTEDPTNGIVTNYDTTAVQVQINALP